MAKIGININTGSLESEDIIFGIDLGTTNSLIAYIPKGDKVPVVVKEADQTTLVPSVLHFGEDEILVGAEARKKQSSDPQNTIYSVKRLMGNTMDLEDDSLKNLGYNIIKSDDEDKLIRVSVRDKNYSPTELSAMILEELKARVKHVLGKDVKKAVITVPAYFSDTQRQVTRDAGKLAGIDVLRIINEPTAASLAYGIGRDSDSPAQNVAVYDLGGGTFDVSILHLEDGVFEVLSTHGDTMLGGDDFDAAIVGFWKEKYPDLDSKNLKILAEEAKKRLGKEEIVKLYDGDVELTISQKDFADITKHLLDETIVAMDQALADSGLQKSEIDQVILVGGSTRMPIVKDTVRNFFGMEPDDSLDPDVTVAMGAAIQADILAGSNQNVLLLDVTPLSLGLETMGGLMDVLIPRNSKVPISKSRQYTTQKDGQAAIQVRIYQGERDLVGDNIFLGEFVLAGIPGMPAGLPKVEVNFSIDTDGILSVSAKELRSGVSQQIMINPKRDLTDAMVEKSLNESLANAHEDKKSRSLLEAKSEAKVVLDSTRSFVQKNQNLLTSLESESLENKTRALESSLDTDDKNLILNKFDELNEYASPIAERVMNHAIKEALSGKNITKDES